MASPKKKNRAQCNRPAHRSRKNTQSAEQVNAEFPEGSSPLRFLLIRGDDIRPVWLLENLLVNQLSGGHVNATTVTYPIDAIELIKTCPFYRGVFVGCDGKDLKKWQPWIARILSLSPQTSIFLIAEHAHMPHFTDAGDVTAAICMDDTPLPTMMAWIRDWTSARDKNVLFERAPMSMRVLRN